MSKRPPPPPAPPVPGKAGNRFALRLAASVRAAHGDAAADTLDASENVGDPTGYVPWGNIAMDRLVGSGFPLGRFVEISGPEDCGKSTMLDQLLAACQREGGLAVLADTERTRRREYMQQLGIVAESLIWVRTTTIEGMFETVETLVRHASDARNRAWADALARAGVKVGKLPTEIYRVYDPATAGKRNRKPTQQWTLVQWSNEARAAVMAYQRDNGLSATGIRNEETAALLRPCIILEENPSKATMKEILECWHAGVPDQRAVSSETPIIVGWDSVAGTASEKELVGSARDVHPASAAKAIRLNMRRMVQMIDDQSFGWLLVNQEYENIDIGWSPTPRRGTGKTTYGGGAIKYHSSVRVRLERREDIFYPGKSKADGHPPCGQVTQALVFKNKMGGNQRQKVRFGLIFGRGACDAWTIYDDLKSRGIIKANGPWSQFTDQDLMPTLGLTHAPWQRSWVGFEDLVQTVPGFDEMVRRLYLEGSQS